jgi:hypothetical protein
MSAFLLPESNIREAGASPELDLTEHRDTGLVLVTFGITRIIEQESIDLSIWGSEDRTAWGAKPLLTFPQKFYCGTYQMLLDLSERPDVKFLQAKWQVNRWGKGNPKPLFTAYIFVQEMQRRVLAMGA